MYSVSRYTTSKSYSTKSSVRYLLYDNLSLTMTHKGKPEVRKEVKVDELDLGFPHIDDKEKEFVLPVKIGSVTFELRAGGDLFNPFS